MNIGIDTVAVFGLNGARGIGSFIRTQLKHLFELDQANRYYLFNPFPECRLADEMELPSHVTEVCHSAGPELYLFQDAEIAEHVFRRFLREYQIDLFYATEPMNPYISYRKSWFGRTRYVSAIYDMIPLLDVDSAFKASGAFLRTMYQRIFEADAILTISECAKQDILRFWGESHQSDVRVAYPGVEEYYQPGLPPAERVEEIKHRYGINAPFFIYTSGDFERKNVAGLLKAFSLLPAKIKENMQVVVVMRFLSQSNESRMRQLVSKLHLQRQVLFTGYVPREDLVTLYQMAEAQTYVSVYEGFGMPVIESMACGLPVVASRNSSVGEISGDAAILVDPYHPRSIARGLQKVLEPETAAKIRLLGIEHAQNYPRDAAARELLKIIQKFEATKIMPGHSFDRPRLAIFTPLPPLPTGVGNYIARLITKLLEKFDIDAIIDTGYVPLDLFEGKVGFVPYTQFRRDKYDYLLYETSNNYVHEYMIPLIKQFPGVVEMHDTNCHGIIYNRTLAKGNEAAYKEFLQIDYPEKKVDEIVKLSKFDPENTVYSYPFQGVFTAHAQKLLLHSKFAESSLLHAADRASSAVIPLLCTVPSNTHDYRETARQSLQLDLQSYVIVSLGHLSLNKRIPSIFQAFKRLQAKVPEARLYLVGSLAYSKDLETEIEKMKLEESVTITGEVEEEVFTKYMQAADVALNLRNCYVGESSYTLTQLFAQGTCTILNDVGAFSEIPDNCCVKLPPVNKISPEQEIALIFRSLHNLYHNPARRLEIGNNAHQFALENWDINQAAERYYHAITTPGKLVLSPQQKENIYRRYLSLPGQSKESDRRNFYQTLEEACK